MTKYTASIRTIDGKEIPVFPRSKKTTIWDSKEKAIRKLESLHIPGQGRIYEIDEKHERILTLTIAL